MKHAIEAIVKNRVAVLVIVTIITALLGSQIRNLRIVIDPVAMLPKAHPNVIGTNTAEELFGSKYVIVAGISAADGGTALRPEVLDAVSRLSKKLADVAGVKRHTMMSVSVDKAKSITGANAEMQVQPLLEQPISTISIQRLGERLKSNPIYQGTLLSKDESTASVSFSIEIGPRGFREVVDRVLAVIEKEKSAALRINVSGTPVYFAAVERFAQRMAFLFPIALLLIGLIHFEAFRTLQGMILPLVTAIMAVIWSLGIMGALKVPLDAFNATTPILILAVAAGHAVQILKRYYEEYDRISMAEPSETPVNTNRRAVVESLTRIAPVMITAGCVAAAGFFSLMSFEIATIRTFGIITGLGILCALIIELTLIPALRSVLKPPPRQARIGGPAKPSHWDRLADRIATLVLNSRKRIALGFALLSIVSATGLLFINRENSTKSYFGESIPLRVEDRLLNSKLSGTNTLYVVFKGDQVDRMKDPALLALVEESQRYIETLPDVGKTISIVDFLRQMNRAMNDGAAASHIAPASKDLVSQYLLLYSISGQPTDFDAYVDYDYRNLNLVVWMKNDSSSYAEAMVTKIRLFVEPKLPAGVSIQIGGSVPQTSALSETLVRGKLQNIGQMILVVLLAGVLVFRSLLAGVYLILPLAVTVLVNFGVMGLFGIPLNTPNSVSSAMGIGIGADYAIYLMYRLREELARSGNFEIALRETIKTAGKAVVYVATAVAGGYSVLLLSVDFYVHIWFGLLIVLSMIVSATTALLLIPSLLTLYLPRSLGKEKFSTTDTPPGPIATPVRTAAAIVFGAVLAGILFAPDAAAQSNPPAPDANDLMQRSYQAVRLDSSISHAVFKLTNASGQERIRKTSGATKLAADGIANRRVIRFLFPGDVRNTTSLLIENSRGDDEIWIYLPALKKARRLASSNKKGSFFGTDLSYGDVVGHKPQAWKHHWIKAEPCNDQLCDVIESIPIAPEIAEESGYSKRLSWVTRKTHLPVKVDMLDAAGAALKTVISSDFKLVDASKGKWQAMRIEAKNLQTGHSTSIIMEKFEANIAVNEDVFSQRYLEREE